MSTIKGIVGSRGKKTGVARVILSLNDVENFNPGDILVTKATNPSWTPLIYAASAVVTDLGGALSHAAIVCREYGKPAVVGTKKGTKEIKNGQMIKVDGNIGEVNFK